MKNKLIDFKELLKTIIIIFCSYVFTSIPLIFLDAFNIENVVINMISQVVFQILFILILCFIYKDIIFNSFKTIKQDFSKKMSKTLFIWFMGLLGMMALNYILNFIINPGGIAENEELVRDVIKINPIFMGFAVCIYAPISEELIFRGGFKKAFSNPLVFVLISGFVFGFQHIVASFDEGITIIEILYLLPYTTLGLSFAYIYHKTDNILFPIIAHGIHNTFTFLLVLLAGGLV